jgi:hypothetical protein
MGDLDQPAELADRSHRRVSSRWSLPPGLLCAAFVLIALEFVRQFLTSFSVSNINSPDLAYATNAASVVGWLLVAAAALAMSDHLGKERRHFAFLLRMSSIGAVLLAVAAGLNLAAVAVIREHFPPLHNTGFYSYVSLLLALERAAAGFTAAGWIAVCGGATLALIRAGRRSHGNSLTTDPWFTVLGFASIAAAANVAANTISFLLLWNYSIGWLDATYGFQAAGWLAVAGALLASVLAARRMHIGRRLLLGLPVGAGGSALLASSFVLGIAFYEMWVANLGLLVRWENGLAAAGWLALAAGSGMSAIGTRETGRANHAEDLEIARAVPIGTLLP